jgi:hypothetical protein
MSTVINIQGQPKLVSGVNIKTINSTSVLGSGDIAVQPTLTLTTTGTSGAATLVGATLNVPQYSGGGGGGIHAQVKLSSGQTIAAVVTGTAPATTGGSANRLSAQPFIPAQTFTCSNLFINVTTLAAGTNARILIYSDINGIPNTKLYESANLDCSTTGQKIATTSFTFTAGTTYWICTHSSSSPSYTSLVVASLLPINTNNSSNSSSYFYTYTFGSAPTTLSGQSLAGINLPAVFITVA